MDRDDLIQAFADSIKLLINTARLQVKSIEALHDIVAHQQAILDTLTGQVKSRRQAKAVRESLERAKREVEELERRHNLRAGSAGGKGSES